jgi:RNA ligase (TIGR02306 family)
MRKLVTVRTIDDLLPVEGADLIQLAKVDGWQCVVKKGEFKKGDLCVYFEIDSFLPIRPEFEFLRKSSYKKMGEKEGFRIRTAKFKGQLSQGLALPISVFVNQFIGSKEDKGQGISEFFFKGNELTDFLGVVKYEPPIPAELSGNVAGVFPVFISKTDQERCQNLGNEIFVDNEDSRYEITVKLDGTSFTAFYMNEREGVCSRNWELKVDESNEHNTLVRMYIDSSLQEVLQKYGKNIAIQGELMGPGIQKNRENLVKHKLFIFDIYDIDNSCYFSPHVRHEILRELWNLGLNKELVDHVPVIAMSESLENLGIYSVAGLLEFAEGSSIVHPVREGLVFKRIDGAFSFKAISNKFLLKEEN